MRYKHPAKIYDFLSEFENFQFATDTCEIQPPCFSDKFYSSHPAEFWKFPTFTANTCPANLLSLIGICLLEAITDLPPRSREMTLLACHQHRACRAQFTKPPINMKINTSLPNLDCYSLPSEMLAILLQKGFVNVSSDCRFCPKLTANTTQNLNVINNTLLCGTFSGDLLLLEGAHLLKIFFLLSIMPSSLSLAQHTNHQLLSTN
jgi:hypothetical protein